MTPRTAPGDPPPGISVPPDLQRRRVITLVVLLAAGLLVAAIAGLHGALETAVGQVAAIMERYPAAGAITFVLLAALSAMLAFFSSAIVIPLGVYRWGEGGACALLLGGWLLGGVASYAIGKFVGTPLLRRLLGGARLSFYRQRVSRRASLGTILLFQLAAPAEITGYVLGAIRYPFPVFVVTRAAGELPFAIGAVFLGEGLLQRKYWLIAAIGMVAVVFATWSLRRLHRILRAEDAMRAA